MINYLNDSWQGKFTGFVEKQQGSRPPMILPDKECGNCAFSCMAQSLLLHYKMCRNDMFYPQMVSLHDGCSKWQGRDSKKMNIDDLISQAKCATVEACVMCDNHVQKWAKPKSDGCDKCHVGKLIEMIKVEKEAQ